MLGSVQRAVDAGAPPGHFLLTGSTQADLTADGWPATGRVLRVPLWNLTQRELASASDQPSLVDLLFGARWDEIETPADIPDITGYLDIALEGGFPTLIGRGSGRYRTEWLAAYVDQSVLRDTAQVGPARDPLRLRRYLQAVAMNTSGVVAHKTLYDAAGVDRLTALSYYKVLEMLHLTEQVPAWSTNQLSRLARTAKRYLVEPALVGPLLKLDRRSVIRNADLTGRLIDTFVAAQLRPELVVAEARPGIFHLRNTDGDHEIDLLLEGPAGGIVAIEIKSASAPTADSWRHLTWLRDALGDRFVCGVVFHAGPRIFRPAERMLALPICTLWGNHSIGSS